ncbi:hypothetical protein pb186bvf_017138 [Paramecium bursaria]
MEQIVIGIKQGDIKYFDDSIDVMACQPYKVHTLKIFYNNSAILGLQVYYQSFKNQQLIKCGDHKVNKLFGVSEQRLILLDDEYVQKISGYANENGINRIEFKTNRQELTIGLQEGEKFEHKIKDNYQLGAIAGGITKQLVFIEWSLIPKPQDQQQSQYNWQLYQLFIQNYDIEQDNLFQQPGIQYRVCEPKIHQDGQGVMSKRFVYFKIVNEKNEAIYRRFKEISTLRDILIQRWPGIYVPPLIVNRMIDDFSNDSIEAIRRSMEYFLIKVSRIPFFVNTVEYGIFINKQNKEMFQEMDFVFQQLKDMTQQITFEQIKLRYQQTFEEFNKTEPLNEEQRLKVNQFSISMQKLENLKITDYNDLKRLFEINSKNLNQLSRYVLPDLNDMHNDEQIRQRSNSLDRAVQLSIDSMNDVYEFFSNEQKEAEALSNALNYIKSLEQQRVSLEAKLNNGKVKEQDVASSKEKLQNIQIIWSILVKGFANFYIDNFFQERYLLFVFMINRLSTIQLNNLKLRQNFWLKVD